MKKELLCLIVLFVLSLGTYAQATKKFTDTGSVKNQFDFLIDKSYRYKNFKNVDITWLNKLKANVADSLVASKSEILSASNIIRSQSETVDSLKTTLNDSTNTITKLKGEIQSISLLGIQFKKGTFKTLLFTIIGILTFLLVIFMGKFNRSNNITKETKNNLSEVEEEFEIHRKRALEREQKVMRKLQDELNKQKKD